MKEVGIVVPTLGKRLALLHSCLNSIRLAGDAYVLIVGPKDFDPTLLFKQGLIDAYVEDLNQGLAAAINRGISSLPGYVKYINWLGDDDQLLPASLSDSLEALQHQPSASFSFGSCRYIDVQGNNLWINVSGPWAARLLPIGPDLVPQPGALIRRKLFDEIQGLDTSYSFAFDYDLFLRLSNKSNPIFLSRDVACFRWHQDSLTVGSRIRSVLEASKVRRKYRSAVIDVTLLPLEILVITATYLAGAFLNKKLKRAASR